MLYDPPDFGKPNEPMKLKSVFQWSLLDPVFSQVVEANNRYLSPALGVIATATGYFQTFRGERSTDQENARNDVPLNDLPGRDRPSTENRPEKFSERGDADRQRVQELMNSGELVHYVPPFKPPPELLARPSPRSKLNRWKLAFFGMLLTFIAAVTPLSVLVARQAPQSTDSSLGRQHERLTETVTETAAARTNLPNNITLTTTQMRATFVTITQVSIRTATLAETKAPKSTGMGSTCDNTKVFLAEKYCVMVTECTQSKLDTEANDCKDFCRAQPKCIKEEQGSLSQQTNDCCGHCGCFD